MQLAVAAAGFTPGEADALRRSMAAWKRRGGLEPYREKLTQGMLERGYERAYAERLFNQIKGFGDYGFPESHAASFALVTYASCWLKCHQPAAFAASLINSQPMGFYSPDQILQDARRHGVRVRPLDVRHSQWDCTLEFPDGDTTANPEIRLGLRLIDGLPQAAAERLQQQREQRPFSDVADLGQRAQLQPRQLALLADAGALKALAGHRHRARWQASGVEKSLPLFAGVAATAEPAPALPVPTPWQDMQADYASSGTTLGKHPLAFMRRQLQAQGYLRSAQLAQLPHGRRVRHAGIVRMRQAPPTAGGVTFVTLEDEDGMVNAVVWHKVMQRHRRLLIESQLLGLQGRWEKVDGVAHLIVERITALDALLGGLHADSRDFR